MRKGFTLIELLVVITIVGILASVVISVIVNRENPEKETKEAVIKRN